MNPQEMSLSSYVSKEDLLARSPFPALAATWISSRNGRLGDLVGKPSSPMRAGAPPEAHSSRRETSSEMDERHREYGAFADKNRIGGLEVDPIVTISDGDIARAGKDPLSGSPESGPCPLGATRGVSTGPYLALR